MCLFALLNVTYHHSDHLDQSFEWEDALTLHCFHPVIRVSLRYVTAAIGNQGLMIRNTTNLKIVFCFVVVILEILAVIL